MRKIFSICVYALSVLCLCALAGACSCASGAPSDNVTTVTIVFIVEGEEYERQTVNEGDAAVLPEDPDPGEGYVFEGWYLDNGEWKQPFSEETEISGNTEVYAKMFKYILNPTNGGTIDTLKENSKVWSTNDYVFTSLPKAFIGKPYVFWSINGPNTATVLKSGWLYVITGEALDFGTANSQMEKLDGYNFTLLDTAFWNIWSASLKNNFIYEKYVEPGESFELGRWTVAIMSDTRLDVYSDEVIPADDWLAVLEPSAGDCVENMSLNAKVFGDRKYTFYDMPFWLAGKNYIQSGYAASSHTASVTKSGFVYMLTSKTGSISLREELVLNGWTDVTDKIPRDLNLFGDSSQGGAFTSDRYGGFALLKKYETV